jgi:hypothetical protein
VRRLGIIVGTALLATALVAAPRGARLTATSAERSGEPADPSAAEYSRAVAGICAGALLFDRAHHMGTRADAVSVARDIRAYTTGRLTRVAAVPVPHDLRRISRRWISSQRRLAAAYARAWVRIYETIDAARTPTERATLAERLHALVHAPDRLRLAAGRLELELHVPDCTGGG